MPRDKKVNTYGVRRRYRGRMVMPAKKGGKGSPRSHSHGGRSQAAAGYECGQPKCYPSKHIPGIYRVQMPAGKVKYIDQDGWR